VTAFLLIYWLYWSGDDRHGAQVETEAAHPETKE
jgi:hypothetical protein